MPIDYKPLWHLLLDREMSKTQLRLASGISTRQLARLGKSEYASTDVLRKICATRNCTLNDIVAITPDKEKAQGN